MRELHQRHSEMQPSHLDASRVATEPETTFDFRTLPAYREIKIVRSTGQTLGIESPFYRRVDEVRGTKIKVGGSWKTNFASYDYLGYNQSKPVADAAALGARQWGVSSTASRVVGGHRFYHEELENRLSEFLGVEDAITMVSGYGTNLAVLRTLMAKGDLVLVDTLAHKSIYEGIHASGADYFAFPHNDIDWIDDKLASVRGEYNNVLIVIEGLYSMDGDVPDLPKFIEIKNLHRSWLMIDEAHSLGVLGKTGRGLCEEFGIDAANVEILMGTLSKALCSCGGFIAGSAGLIDLLRFKAPGFVYSVGLSAPNSFAANEALNMLANDNGPVERLRELSAYFFEKADHYDLDCGAGGDYPIIPLMTWDSLAATWISNMLFENGFNVQPIISPAVPNKAARLRFFLTANHKTSEIDEVLLATSKFVKEANDTNLIDQWVKSQSDLGSSS